MSASRISYKLFPSAATPWYFISLVSCVLFRPRKHVRAATTRRGAARPVTRSLPPSPPGSSLGS
eukprot:6935363-Pyramimonas_sp.AAC.1